MGFNSGFKGLIVFTAHTQNI